MSLFDTAANISLSGWTKANGQPLDDAEKAALREHFRSAGLERFAHDTIADPNTRARLADGSVYVTFSGTGAEVYADTYIEEMEKSGLKAGKIGDTPFGTEIERLRLDGYFDTQVEALQNFARNNLGGELAFEGTRLGNRGIADILFNFGSSDYIQNGKENGAGYFRGFFADDASSSRAFAVIEQSELAGEILNGKVVSASETLPDTLEHSKAFALTESTIKQLHMNEDGTVNRATLELALESEAGRRKTAQIADMLRELRAVEPDYVAPNSLARIERDYIRTFRADMTKISRFANYASDLVDLIGEKINEAPEAIRAQLTKYADLVKSGFAGIAPDKARRMALTASGGLVALTEIWVESERRGGFESPEFLEWAQDAAKDALIALPVLGGGLWLAGLTPLGPAVGIALTAAGAYASIRNIADGLSVQYAPAEGEEPGLVYKAAKSILDMFEAIEGQIGYAFNAAAKLFSGLVDGAVSALSDWTVENIDFIGGETAHLIYDGGLFEGTSPTKLSSNWVVADDYALVVGSDKNNLVIHKGFGEVFGEAGDDTLIGWRPIYLAEDELVDRELREFEADGGQVDDNEGVRAPEGGYRLLLDGGAGNDWVFALGGTGAITVGGAGRDFLYNSSFKGQLWGDGLDGRGASNTGSGTDDTFWWSAGSFIMDAGKNDRLQLFGLPLVGGSNALYYGVGLERAVARDFLLPWVTYGVTEAGQLLVEASFGAQLNPAMGEDAILEVAQVVENWQPGDLGIEFIVRGGGDEISLLKSLFKLLGAQADAIKRFAKNAAWQPTDDPIVLDLNGDGLVSKGLGATYFDQDGDGFAERTGWIDGNDGFLVHDADGSGTIDDVSER
jgi:hypothetical protein